ncbi:MAG: hypothetical protein JWQ01_806 [Massilia sp.]|nr:hypothetical protein [Massilia sp.]
MDMKLKASLRKIGIDLDTDSFPEVKNGGFVVPSTAIVSPIDLGEEFYNVGPKGRSEVKPRPRTSGRPRPPRQPRTPGGSRAPSSTASLIGAELRGQYEKELTAVEVAYPGTQHWLNDDAIWLVVESSLLPDLGYKAYFVVAIFLGNPAVKSWGFWGTPVVGYEWIGPRHTNFPDGSICAFDLTDGTWEMGQSLVKLLDLYTIWAVRHLHYRVFGRWPGFQSVSHVYERVLEMKANEFCGCSNYRTLYGECCMQRDQSSNLLREAVGFLLWSGGGLRRPPNSIIKFLQDRTTAPELAEAFRS